MPIDPTEAPEGYEAVELEEPRSCAGCSFAPCPECDRVDCMKWQRRDGQSVVFVSQTADEESQ